MTRELFDFAVAELHKLYAGLPGLAEFHPLPEMMVWADLKPSTVAGTQVFLKDPGRASDVTAPLVQSLLALADHAKWNHSYTEDEVGAAFLANYGWFELIGPHGHFRSDRSRIMFGYWGSGLWYDWHHHQSAELYVTLAGGATFLTEGRDPRNCVPGDIHEHKPMQNHAMQVNKDPIFAMAVWKGDGLTGPPLMGRA